MLTVDTILSFSAHPSHLPKVYKPADFPRQTNPCNYKTKHAMSLLIELNNIIHSIRSIHEWSGTLSEYRTAVKDVISQILRLLYYDDSQQLALKCIVNHHQHEIDDLFLTYARIDGHKNQPEPSKVHLVEMILNYRYQHIDSHTLALLQLLNEVDSDQLEILTSLTNVFEFFVQIHRRAENSLVDYLASCIDYEIQCNDIRKSAVGGTLNEDETEQLIHKLDLINEPDAKNYDNDISNEIQPFMPPSLELLSNDPVFLELYHVFLEIISFKYNRDRGSIRDYRRYTRVMVNLYMRIRTIGSLELDTFEVQESKVNFLYEFLFNDIVNTEDQSLVRAANQAFDELQLLNTKSFDRQQTSIESSPPKDFFLSQIERGEIINHIREFIPDLNDFNFSFDSNFPHQLATYFDLAFSEMTDKVTSGDQNFILSLNTSISEIDRFNSGNDDNVDIKDAVIQFHHLHTRFYSPESTFLMKVAQMLFARSISVVHTQFKLWHLKFLKYAHDEYILQVKYKPNQRIKTKTLQKWFSKSKRSRDVLALGVKYNLRLIQSLYFAKWQVKTEELDGKIKNADQHLKRKQFNCWLEKYRNFSTQMEKADQHQTGNTLKKAMAKLQLRDQNLRELGQTADSYALASSYKVNALLLDVFFNQWITKVNELFSGSHITAHQIENGSRLLENSPINPKVKLLLMAEKRFIKSKFLSKLSKMQSLATILKAVEKKNQNHIVRVFFELWKRLSLLNNAAANFDARKVVNIKADYWKLWKNEMQVRIVQQTYYRDRLLKWAFQLWRGNFELLGRDYDKVSRPVVSIFMKKWKLSFQILVWNKHKENKQFEKLFASFQQKRKQVLHNVQLASENDEVRLKKRSLVIWKAKHSRNEALLQYSDVFTLDKFFNKVVARESKIISLRDAKSELGPIYEKLLMKLYLKVWFKKREKRYSIEANERINFYLITIQRPLIQAKFFRQWIKQTTGKQRWEQMMEQKCRAFQSQSYSLSTFFYQWHDLTLATYDLQSDAIDFHRRMLMKKALVIWYDQYSKQSQLNDISTEFKDQRDFSKLREVLNLWSMKVLKYVNRNQQSCDLFIKKWNQTRTRDFFDLWRSNLSSSRKSRPEEGDSTISNQSPLANKLLRNGSGSPSYLNTPLKKSPTRGSALSTSRLESTTLRVKTQRIDALKRRFGGAKSRINALSPREVSDSYQRNPVRLLPPKVRSSLRSILPPEPPNFGIQGMSTPSSDNQIDEMSMIATAKKLKRITPIFIPTEDDTAELQNQVAGTDVF